MKKAVLVVVELSKMLCKLSTFADFLRLKEVSTVQVLVGLPRQPV